MPCFNSAKYIGQAINSVISQSYLDWELLVIDNGSTDNSLDIIKEYSLTDDRIYLYEEKKKGAASARNKGISMASGQFIAFLDSDDIWEATKLEQTISFMKKKNINLACTSYAPFDSNSLKASNVRVPPPIINRRRLLKTCDIGCSTVVIDVSRFKGRIGDILLPDLPKEDYAYWFDLIRIYNEPFYGLDKSLTRYRVHLNSISSNKLKQIKLQYNVYRKHLSIGRVKSLMFLFAYILYGFRKTYLND